MAADLNDGVRVNIRPFMMAADIGKKGAGILRVKPNIKWNKDRGKEPSRSKDEFPWFWGWDGKSEDFAGGAPSMEIAGTTCTIRVSSRSPHVVRGASHEPS